MRTDKIWQGAELAECYLSGIRGGIPFAMEQIDIALRLVEADGLSVKRFADLGCGDGILSSILLQRYPEARGVALDFSEPMLNQARQKLEPFGLEPFGDAASQGSRQRITCIQADLYEPTWQEHLTEDFDLIISGYCIHHLPHDRKQALYREIYQRLHPGGYFFNIEHVASADPWLEQVWNEFLVDALYQWQSQQDSSITREEVASRYVYRQDKQANILAPVEVQCNWLREIGFDRVDCYFKCFELAVFGGKRPVG